MLHKGTGQGLGSVPVPTPPAAYRGVQALERSQHSHGIIWTRENWNLCMRKYVGFFFIQLRGTFRTSLEWSGIGYFYEYQKGTDLLLIRMKSPRMDRKVQSSNHIQISLYACSWGCQSTFLPPDLPQPTLCLYYNISKHVLLPVFWFWQKDSPQMLLAERSCVPVQDGSCSSSAGVEMGKCWSCSPDSTLILLVWWWGGDMDYPIVRPFHSSGQGVGHKQGVLGCPWLPHG